MGGVQWLYLWEAYLWGHRDTSRWWRVSNHFGLCALARLCQSGGSHEGLGWLILPRYIHGWSNLDCWKTGYGWRSHSMLAGFCQKEEAHWEWEEGSKGFHFWWHPWLLSTDGSLGGHHWQWFLARIDWRCQAGQKAAEVTPSHQEDWHSSWSEVEEDAGHLYFHPWHL